MIKPSAGAGLKLVSIVMFWIANAVAFYMCLLASHQIFDNDTVVFITAILNAVFITSLSRMSAVTLERSKRMAQATSPWHFVSPTSHYEEILQPVLQAIYGELKTMYPQSLTTVRIELSETIGEIIEELEKRRGHIIGPDDKLRIFGHDAVIVSNHDDLIDGTWRIVISEKMQ